MKNRRFLTYLLFCIFFAGQIGLSGESHAKEQIKLRFGTLDGPNTIIGKGQAWYLERVEELSKGRIKFENYWSSSLVPARQLLDALNTGVADVSFLIPGYYPSKLSLLTVGTLPTTYKNAFTFGMALHDLVLETPAVSNEMAKWGAVYLTSAAFPPFNLLSKSPINSINTLKGMKVRTFGGMAMLVKQFGAVVVSLPTPQVYTALQRGTIDAAIYPPLLILDFKLHETAKYLWDQPIGSNVSAIGMRKAKWDSLSGDLKSIFRKAAIEHQIAYHRIVQVEGNEGSARKKLLESGVKIAPGSKEATARINEKVGLIWADWIKNMEGKGKPGQMVADKFRSLLVKYSKRVPK
jgi:TRAP-type C4-dicarboxylate transport system substrate-binding protein